MVHQQVRHCTMVDLSGSGHVSHVMRNYCTNTHECRRKFLMREFSEDDVALPAYLHQCCDLCATVCMCENCSAMDASEVRAQVNTHETLPSIPLNVHKELYAKLTNYRKYLRQSAGPATLLVGTDTCTGLTTKCIDRIVNNSPQITSVEDLLQLGVTSLEYCTVILEIINSVNSYQDSQHV